MTEKYSRRHIVGLGSIISVSGCLNWVPGTEDNDTNDPEIHPEIAALSEEAENQIRDEEILIPYEEADNRILADTVEVEPNMIREVGIGDAQEYRVSAELELGRNADDLVGYVDEDRETLIEKVSEPSYDMTTVVFENLEEYDAEERNVHQTRITQYQTRFHGRDDNFVHYRLSNEELRELEDEEEYLENFRNNADVYIDGETY